MHGSTKVNVLLHFQFSWLVALISFQLKKVVKKTNFVYYENVVPLKKHEGHVHVSRSLIEKWEISGK